jgi:hypothetical protein|tara:strand:- start:332 stop:790 length:459 start_codon:yes stop_codon:yes gene_type:complete
MGIQTAIVGAMGVAQYKSQGAIGDFNQSVNNRNAEVLEKQAEAIEKKTEFDLKQFDKEFVKLRGTTVVQNAKSGVVYSGSALRIARSNEREKILQENLMKYNSKMNIATKMEEAKFARIKGDMAQQSAKLAQIQTASQTGMSLLTMTKGTTV